MELRKDTRTARRRLSPSATPQQLLEIGKLPPQANDIEEAVLGALMLSKEALTNIVGMLRPEVFYKESHQYVFAAIQGLFSKAEPVDILTVTQELKKTGLLEKIEGGAFFISGLTNRLASAANAEMYARIVLEKYIQRELIEISTNTIDDAYEEGSDVFELLGNAEKRLFDISQKNIRKDFQHILPVLKDTINEFEAARDQKLVGVQSGFTALDRITGGWQRSDLIILAARPGTGKSAFVVTVARNAAVNFQKPVAIFSLEMTNIQLAGRLIAAETELPSDKLRSGKLEDYEFQLLHSKIRTLETAPIYVDDTPALSIFEFRAKARRLKAQHDISLIIIDYLQLMVSGQEGKFSREQEVSTISRSLKAIAKELNVPIIALSQLSRAVEQRGGSKRPQLSDLRESGAIEQDADLVMFIYRADKSGITIDEQGNSTEGMAELIIAKHRNGRVGSVNLMFVEHLAKFIETSETLAFTSDEDAYTPKTITVQSKLNQNDHNVEEDF
jgi:replicative DNA helicase